MMASERLRQIFAGRLGEDIRDMNPWWAEDARPSTPPLRRWPFPILLKHVHSGMTPIMAVRGPRQVGKSTLMNQVIGELLDTGVAPKRILRVQLDRLPQSELLTAPLLEIPRWYTQEIVGKSLNAAAHDGEQAFVFFDEVQTVPDWSIQLKHLVDINPVRAIVTGSSALSIEAGKESLAGRVVTLEMGPLLLREVAAVRGLGEILPLLPPNGLAPLASKSFWQSLRRHGEQHRDVRDAAFRAFGERGGFPAAQVNANEPWEAVAALLVETVVDRVVRLDAAATVRGHERDPLLLESVLRAAFRFAGQAPQPAYLVDDVKRSIAADVSWQRVHAYLRILHESLLVRLVGPLEMRLKRREGGDRICLCDHALRAAWLGEVVPLSPYGLEQQPHLSEIAGRIAESVAGGFFAAIRHLGVAHFPARVGAPEVDFVLTVGEQRIPVEVKYRRRIDYKDTLGLRAFIEKAHYNAPFGVLVTLLDDAASDDPRIVSLPLSSLLLMR